MANAKKKTAKKAAKKAASPKLLAGGNPQIAKGYGEASVKAYIAAMPGWKRAIGKRIDAIISAAAPGVKKAVKWNSPFYGAEEGHYFLCFHVYARYVQVSFLNGAALNPLPPKPSKHPRVRYLDIYEGAFDEAQFKAWVAEAARLPGETM